MKMSLAKNLLFVILVLSVSYIQSKEYRRTDLNQSAIISTDTLKHAFVGAETCGMCHRTAPQGEQLGIWKKSLHSKAYETLKTEKADSIAKSLGLTKAVESEQCLKCHSSGHNVDKAFLKMKFKVEDGVQCETCHGPGEDYKALPIMKNREKAIANGLFRPASDQIEEFCKKCHNNESPTFVKFDFSDQWSRIKHYIPNKK